MKLAAIALLGSCWTGSPGSSPQPRSVATPPPVIAKDPSDGSTGVIQRNLGGGVIELNGDRRTAMADAVKEMTEHCGADNFVIVQEGEEAIGSDTGGPGGLAITTAWRVHYQCNGPAAP